MPDSDATVYYSPRERWARVFDAPSGVALLNALDAEGWEKLDAALIDMHMPQLSGLGTIAELRKRGYEGLIVAMSADPGRKLPSLGAGADAFIRKPFVLDQLADRLSAGLP